MVKILPEKPVIKIRIALQSLAWREAAEILLSAQKDVQLVEEGADILIQEGGESVEKASSVILSVSFPMRPGVLLQQIRTAAQAPKIALPDRLNLHDITILPKLLQAAREGETPITLTEKERDILVYLAECTSFEAGRESILPAVWGYVEGVETHTLETHIYRLRQKIEKDSSHPQNLLTTERGYRLQVIEK